MLLRGIPYLVLFPALFWAVSVVAQMRPIPPEAKRAYLRHVQEMAVSLDGVPMQLASGAIIRDQKNLIVVPVSIPREGAWADYTVDSNRQVVRVWLLTPEELARRRRQSSGP